MTPLRPIRPGRALPRRFYARATADVARELVGHVLVHDTPAGRLTGRIVETEAYVGPEDRACHAWHGRTKRTDVMFGPPGRAYVYLVYGMHHCLNVVTEREGFPAAVLIRALEPLTGLDGVNVSGPGRICRALGIDRSHTRVDLTWGPIRIVGGRGLPERITRSQRIGIDYAGAWARRLLRFSEAGNPHVTRPRKRSRR